MQDLILFILSILYIDVSNAANRCNETCPYSPKEMEAPCFTLV